MPAQFVRAGRVRLNLDVVTRYEDDEGGRLILHFVGGGSLALSGTAAASVLAQLDGLTGAGAGGETAAPAPAPESASTAAPAPATATASAGKT